MYIDAGFHLQSTFNVQGEARCFFRIEHAITWTQLCCRYSDPNGRNPYSVHVPVLLLDWKLTSEQKLLVVDGIYLMSEYQARARADFTIVHGAGSLCFNCEDSRAGFFELRGSDYRQGSKDGAEFTPDFIVRACADFTDINGSALVVEVEDFYGHSPDGEDWSFKDDPVKRRVIVRAFLRLWPEIAPGKPMPILKICGKQIRYGSYRN